jgi:mannose-1-phosphate guanylyltransferase/mannose-6-phosphate isomerase
MKIVILAGGRGTRLWPLSRYSLPKQFLHFGDKRSLLQKTLLRFTEKYKKEDIIILTSSSYADLVKLQCAELFSDFSFTILVEPESKNTAAALALAACYIQELGGDAMLVVPSDHMMQDEKQFLDELVKAEDAAAEGAIVTFGVMPSFPETGYGYIRYNKEDRGPAMAVEQFVEKPSYDVAKSYVTSGCYLWNAGIFFFKISTFWQELERQRPDMYSCFSSGYSQALSSFSRCPDVSIDYAIMEGAKKVVVIPLHVAWSDVGSWDSVYAHLDKDLDGNVISGNIVNVDSTGCLLYGSKRLVATIGLEDAIVVDTGDALLVSKRGSSQKVKDLVDILKKRRATECIEHITSERPWGSFTILEEGERFKIKRIVVFPGKRLSLQMHYHRSEHWVVVKGSALVTVGDSRQLLGENQSIFIPKSEVHRLENPGKVPLEIIEVQVGEYVGEDDIVRIEDDFARVQKDDPKSLLRRLIPDKGELVGQRG